MGITDENRRWWVLAGTCLGLFQLMLDSTVVGLALPDIRRDLGATTTELQWILNVYLLVLAVLVVTVGRLGDMFGRKRVFLAGLVLFLAGSIVGALADDAAVVILARVVQAMGGAPMLSLSLAILSDAFPAAQRGTALGIWAGVSSVALAVGPLIGGALVEGLSWRWIFWINVPVLALGFFITLAAASESRDPTAGRRIDWPGLATLSTGLVAAVLALVEGPTWGWGSASTLGCLLGGIALLGCFIAVEARVPHPIIELGLFRNRPYFGACAAAFAIVGAFWSILFFEPQYLQEVLGHSALAAGLLMLPSMAPLMVLSPLTGRLIARFGARALMTFGMALGTVGVLVMSLVNPDTGYGLLFWGFLGFGLSLALVYAPMSAAAMEAMPDDKAGIAAGVLGMLRVGAGTVWLAIAGAVFQHGEIERRDELGPAAPLADVFDFALGRALLVLVGLMGVGTVLTWLFVRGSTPARHRHHAALHAHGHLPAEVGRILGR